MAKQQVILVKKISGLGGESDQVSVAAGYARNYLIPYGMAVPVTRANKRRLDVLAQRRSVRESQELSAAKELSSSLAKLVLTIRVKTGEDGKMYGSVTAASIAEELERQFEVSIDRRKIHLDGPIKSLGDYEVELRLHPDINAKLSLKIGSEFSESATGG